MFQEETKFMLGGEWMDCTQDNGRHPFIFYSAERLQLTV